MVAEDNTLVRRIAFWGIPLAFGVMGLKLLAWWVTGSVALLSDGLESTVNVIAAFLAYFVIRYAQKPADDDHPYGHHKAEYLSAVLEGVLIVVAALLIIREAIPALQAPTLPDAPFLGLAINGAAAVINAAWATLLIRVGRSHRSPALSADGQHIMSDVVTSVGVIIGLVLVLATGYAILDPILAILVALNIIWQGWKVIAQSVAGLMDVAVSPDEAEAIREAIKENSEGSLGVHYLRSRRAGAATFVAFDLVVPSKMTVRDAHVICDRLEMAVHKAVPGTRVTIHVEPENEMAHGAGVELGR
ncbi:cation diffusion facilitator family transporter [Rhizobium rosettiformans]|uniref:Cation transporter n=2 Tax=Rhizobium rosettiformans TaxID=1368430 RepID=A0A4S8PXU0_9HYPH|nr:cation diffusion facilitator family transporter [Rhizobium rosettiformans]MBA4799900.1 cation transporter [Hyphomicrobiales bacterium]MBB5276701.1 cation diffusion facilitator family transporter [Rhizobium rosettiformans]MDR7029631.1 cation diffusion facilitator family transporter [Rhizobium rosettiformans]MDR7063345.1 cation diffusion facilitator family transporter [Rhizobium rosettiformans]THV35451.1 cation transporter [Rhizobium rosettiformans W3]